jgi:hypothetical protein
MAGSGSGSGRGANTRTSTQARLRIPEAVDKSVAELLVKVKPIIPGALRSGDIEVITPEDQGPDAEPLGNQWLQDYPVEVPGVLLSKNIQNRKSPENEAIIRICIYQENKTSDDTPNRNQQN